MITIAILIAYAACVTLSHVWFIHDYFVAKNIGIRFNTTKFQFFFQTWGWPLFFIWYTLVSLYSGLIKLFEAVVWLYTFRNDRPYP